ncbi:SNARE associated Golgi protein [Musa troglodytarum]|uniref:SNARE associated Golgi protein n=1 Tax=Musa troglodytarum TaxID=320322 RepID=A0A9E7GFZ3_9LILI|nr:SNARE associated Golgi protein [Musa troglodytarum]
MRVGSRYPKRRRFCHGARYESSRKRRFLFAGSGWKSPFSGKTGNTASQSPKSKSGRVLAGDNVFSGSTETGELSPPLLSWSCYRSRKVRTILRAKTYAEKNSSARSIFIILVLFRRRRPAETEERQVRDGVGVDPVGNDGWGDAAAGWNRSAVRVWLRGGSERPAERLGMWAIPAYVVAHTVALALCLPYAVFFEVSASLLFGFLPAVLSVFSAKVLGASLAFWIGRQCFGAQNQQQSGHTAADTSISLPEDLNAMVGDLCFLLGSHPCPLMSLTMDWLPLK